MTTTHRRMLIALGVTAAVDLTSKVVAAATLDDRSIEIGGGLALRLTHNTGAAFGLGNTLPLGVVQAITLSVTILIATLGWRGVLGPPVVAGIIAGGALANVLDRQVGGSVVDMIYLPWWPTFNLADVAITTGSVSLMAYSFIAERHEKAAPEGVEKSSAE